MRIYHQSVIFAILRNFEEKTDYSSAEIMLHASSDYKPPCIKTYILNLLPELIQEFAAGIFF